MSSPNPVLANGTTINTTVAFALPGPATETTNGLMSSTDKVKLDSVTSGAAPVGSAVPLPVAASSPVVGSSGVASRQDHQHAHGNLAGVDGSNVPLHATPIYAKASLPSPAYNTVVQLSDENRGRLFSNGTRWVPPTGLDVYVMEDFGGKADAGITDNLIAWNAIMTVIAKTYGYGGQSGQTGAIIRFGPGIYNFSGTPKLTVRGCTVQGSGGASDSSRTLLTVPVGTIGFIVGDPDDGGWGGGAYLRDFAVSGNGYLVGGTPSNNNVNGWVANHAYTVGAVIQPAYSVNNGSKWGGYLWRCTTAGTSGGSEPAWSIANTLDTYTETNPTQSDGSAIWTAVQNHGIVIHAGVHAENVSVNGFTGNGWHILGDTSSSNTDLSTFINCNSTSNAGSGFWTHGTDAAPSVYMMCNSLANLGYGFYDFAVEGNIYINCHTRSNGCWHWFADGVILGLNQLIGPTEPNGYLYMVTQVGTLASTEPVWPTSIGDTVTSGTVVMTCQRPYSGGAYYMRYSRLLACYSEGDQQPTVLENVGAWSEGGAHGAGFVADPTASGGRIELSRFDNNSFGVVSDNGDGHPITSWWGSKNSGKNGWSLAYTINGSYVAGTDLDLVFRTGGTTGNGWRYQTNSGANCAQVITDGTESGVSPGLSQFPSGFWLGGPQSPAGGSFVQNGANSTTFPSPSGQLGDVIISSAGGPGIALWCNIGLSADDGNVQRWAIGTEAGAFHPIDISATSVGSPYTVTRGDHNAVFHNRGASVKSSVKLRYADEFPYARQKFIVAASAGIRVVSQHGSKIVYPGTDSGDAGYIESTQLGATLTLESLSGVYFVSSIVGSWNINGTPIT